MSPNQAIALIHQEHDDQNGLDTLFRLSEDVDEERIAEFIQALKIIEQHYQNKELIERDLVYKLFSLHQTLQSSSSHWKVARPKGLDKKTCFEIHSSIHSIFST